eukprot:m.588077 g.588077  ORF g.588077 m.588077 type:complete len:50 (+) comp22360_c0_seq11:634-783(+)
MRTAGSAFHIMMPPGVSACILVRCSPVACATLRHWHLGVRDTTCTELFH